jgi:endonuclease/exonuclease/phosphatase family metal-dependent hydrolase
MLASTMRAAVVGVACVVAALTARPQGAGTCGARTPVVDGVAITWHTGAAEDHESLDRWCRGVGPPVVAPAPAHPVATVAPALEDLVVITWNHHLADGRLDELVRDLRAGHLTDGRPVPHFVLLLQELYRRGQDVPAFAPDARSAIGIKARDPRAPDARDYASKLGLALLYVPSMRNGTDMLEDRGNAIVSTEPWLDAWALELPLERQRRVAAGLAIRVRTQRGIERLDLLNVHLEPLSAPSALWLFRNPRRRQMAAVLDRLGAPRFEPGPTSAGTVLGGDFNTIQGGVEEDVYGQARAWARGLATEDPRPTHAMGRLDYLFVRLGHGWEATTTRVEDKYGSDHHPVLARFRRVEPMRNMW